MESCTVLIIHSVIHTLSVIVVPREEGQPVRHDVGIIRVDKSLGLGLVA